MLLYNTLTGKKEEFKPLDKGLVRMYHCGPTVYNFAHIGNLRAYVFADVLRRTLEYLGYEVKQVVNITDVGHLTSDGDEGDDKMVRALKRLKKPMTLVAMKEVADIYSDAFVEDIDALNIERPHEMPRASEHIDDDIELVKVLEKKGFTYAAAGGVYFDTAKFSEYGRFGRINLDGQKAGARVEINPEKQSPIDFTLWKTSTNELGWESPWGKGFPGWHIECSAMSRKYLGQPFDIHTGGIDHIPVHHQNEIAQSKAAYGVPLANYWLHNEFVTMSGGKMAKSEGNFTTLRTLKENGIYPLAYRYFLLQASYRSPISFSVEALLAAETSYLKLLLTFGRLNGAGSVHREYRERFEGSIADDLNTSGGIAILWDLLKDASVSGADKRASVLDFDRVLGLDIGRQTEELYKRMRDIPGEVRTLAGEREEARKRKDFATSDRLRGQIQAAGFEVTDTDSGPVVHKKI